jgi:uncharacterized repeat protein (TIGR02543 family)
MGWFSGNTEYTSGTWTELEDITLTASWTKNVYNVVLDDTLINRSSVNVVFDHNYSGSTPTTLTLANGNSFSAPDNPVRSGYVFAGWYTDSSCTVQYNFGGEITSDLTLYAGWNGCSITNNSSSPWSVIDGVLTSTNKGNSTSSTYKIVASQSMTVTFNYKTSSESGFDKLYIKKNGTSLTSCSGINSYTSYSVILNSGDYLEFVYSKDGSTSSGSDCAYIQNLTYTSNVSYSGSTTVSCSEIDGFVYEDGSTYTLEATYDNLLTLPTPERTGYTFLGWYNGNERVESGVWNIASNVTLTARWQLNS